jgi:two-component system, NarL family, response regulator NreC
VRIRVVLVDDHALVRQALGVMMAADRIEVVAEADNGHTAVELVSKLHPDLVLMDVSMRDLNGIEATRRIRDALPSVRVIGLSMHSTPQFVRGMLDAGASGYVLKTEGYDELHRAVRSVARGMIYLSPLLAAQVVNARFRAERGDSIQVPSLAPREREVLQLLAEGHKSASIGQKLCISFHTVESHRRNIMRKLNLHSIAELTRYALREGLTPLD